MTRFYCTLFRSKPIDTNEVFAEAVRFLQEKNRNLIPFNFKTHL